MNSKIIALIIPSLLLLSACGTQPDQSISDQSQPPVMQGQDEEPEKTFVEVPPETAEPEGVESDTSREGGATLDSPTNVGEGLAAPIMTQPLETGGSDAIEEGELEQDSPQETVAVETEETEVEPEPDPTVDNAEGPEDAVADGETRRSVEEILAGGIEGCESEPTESLYDRCLSYFDVVDEGALPYEEDEEPVYEESNGSQSVDTSGHDEPRPPLE